MSRSLSSRIIIVLALSTLSIDSDGRTVDGGSSAVISDALLFPRSWVTDMFSEALTNFSVRDVGSAACQKQSETYDRHLRNFTSWAVKMAESWNRRPIGILTGNQYQLGVYDECVQVKGLVRGQYCISEIKLLPAIKKDYSYNRTKDTDYFGNNHAWHTILGWIDYPDQIPRNILDLGICIPDSCSAADLQTSLQKELDKVFVPEHVKTVVKVDPLMCTVGEDMYPYSSGYYITNVFLLLLVLICCCATLRHFIILSSQQNKKKDITGEVSDSFFNSFSFIRSSMELLKFDKQNGPLNALNGVKFMTMTFILFGHKFLFYAGHPSVYTIPFEQIYLFGPDIVLTSMNLVDPFFFMSGYLMYLTIYPVFIKSGSVLIKLTSPIVYRIIRMLPAYCAMMAITAHIVPHLGDGPLWPRKIWDEADNCKKNWWMNLLFINNFIDSKHQCLLVSWYISCDFQFFIVGTLILYIYAKNKRIGTCLCVSMLCASIAIPFIITLLTKGEGILKVHIPFLENPRSSKSFNDAYRQSYMRATPFFIGVLTALIIEKMNEKKIKFSLTTVYTGTVIVYVTCLWAQLYGAKLYIRHRPYYPLEQALYATLRHCIWSVLGMWVCICHFTSGYGLLTHIFSNRLMVALGRLSYSVFLVNLIVMAVSQSSQRLPTNPTAMGLLNAWIYDMFKCYLMALALYLTVESPFGNVTRKIFGRRSKNISQITNGVQTIENVYNTTETPKKDSINI